MKQFRIPLQVVFYREDDQWIAHCLQFDLVGVADTKEEAMRLLNEATVIQIQESITGNLRNLFTLADSKYFQMFAEGTDVLEGELRIKIEPEPAPGVVIERTDVREFRRPLGRRIGCNELVPA